MRIPLVLFMCLALLSCATGDAKVVLNDDGATVTGNAPGRTITYTKGDTTVTVKDERTPNPIKSLWDTVMGLTKKAVESAQVAIGD